MSLNPVFIYLIFHPHVPKLMLKAKKIIKIQNTKNRIYGPHAFDSWQTLFFALGLCVIMSLNSHGTEVVLDAWRQTDQRWRSEVCHSFSLDAWSYSFVHSQPQSSISFSWLRITICMDPRKNESMFLCSWDGSSHCYAPCCLAESPFPTESLDLKALVTRIRSRRSRYECPIAGSWHESVSVGDRQHCHQGRSYHIAQVGILGTKTTITSNHIATAHSW